MKLTKLLLFLIVVGYSFTARASYINEDDAVQLVKMNRAANGLDNSTVNFYIAEVDTLTNNEACVPNLTGETENWLLDNSPKWLVFVDEHPFRSWYHECSYYYMSATVREDDVVIKKFTGCLPPEENLVPMELNSVLDISNLPDFTFPERPLYSPGDNHLCTDSTYVVLSATGYLENQLKSNYKDVRAVYQMLTRVFGIDKSHIRIAVGSGVDENGYTHCVKTASRIYFDKDLDGDGENEIFENANNNLGAIVSEMCNTDLYPDCRHLFIFQATDYFPADGYDTIDYFSYNVGGDNLRFLNIFRHGYTIPELNNVPFNTVITQDITSQCDFSPWNPCNQMVLDWINAMTGYNVMTGTPVNADYNNDGIISMAEAAAYADPTGLNINCNSNQSTLASVLSLNHYPSSPRLSIRNRDEQALNIPGYVTWASPDIWVRNQDDGLLHQESEHITANGATKYVYVRVHNNSNKDYDGFGQRLYLYGINHLPLLNLSRINSTEIDVIDSLTMEQPIPAGGSHIYKFETTGVYNLPLFGGVVTKELIAATGYVSPNYEKCGYSRNLEEPSTAINKRFAIEPAKGTLTWAQGSSSRPFYSVFQCNGVKLPILIPNCQSLEIVNTNREKRDRNAFNIALEFEYSPYDFMQYTGLNLSESEPNMLILSSDSATIFCEDSLPLFYDGDMVTLWCFDRGMESSSDKEYEFSIIARDEMGTIVGATSYSLKLNGSDFHGGGIIIRPTSDGQNNILLSALNTDSEAVINWYGEQNEHVGNGKTLCINKDDVQDYYTLQSRDLEKGLIQVRTIDTENINLIENISIEGTSLSLKLWKPASSNTTISVSSLDGNYMIRNNTTLDEDVVTMQCTNAPSGIYTVGLWVNDILVESKQIRL